MEYIEMAAPPKAMFDKMISNDGLRVPFGANVPTGPGFRPMPLPVFSHGKALSSVGMAPVPPSGTASEFSRRGAIPSFVATGMPLTGSQMAIVNNGNGNLGILPVQLPGESGSSLLGDDTMEKGKRSRGEGGKGSRGGGSSSRKRSRGQADSLTTPGATRESSVSTGPLQPAGRVTVAAAGTRLLPSLSGEKADKTNSKKCGQVGKRGDKKQSQVATSGNDDLPQKMGEVDGLSSGWSNGILDIYGLRARVMDVSRFMVDIPLDDLLSRKFEVPSFFLKNNEDQKVEIEDRLGQQIDGLLYMLPKKPHAEGAQFSKTIDVSGAKNLNNTNLTLDLEHSLHHQDGGGAKVGKATTKMQNYTASAKNIEGGADTEPLASSTVVSNDGVVSSPGPLKFVIGSLPVQSVESFLSRLKLISSDPLQSLGPQAWTESEMSASVDNRHGRDVVELCHRNGSVPPLSFSHPHVGPPKAEVSRYNPRVWVRTPTAEISGGDVGTGSSGKEASNGAEEDASTSPSSRLRNLDNKDNGQSPAAIHQSCPGTPSLSASQIAPPTAVTVEDLATVIKEEPNVENAVGQSSEASGNPMEIDSKQVENGSTPAKRAESGNAVRPLETPATIVGPDEMDTSSDQQEKPFTTPLAEVKLENVEQIMKDPAESSGGDGQEPKVANQESESLDPLEMKSNIRISPPPENEPSGLPDCPSSPGAQAAARLLCSIANSTLFLDLDKNGLEGESRRRVFQSYLGAPAQKSTKSIKVSNSVDTPADSGREWKRSADGGCVPPSKALVSERRKSLCQVNDVSDKPSQPSRNFGSGGISTSSRGGNHTGSRSSTLSIKVSPRETPKDSSSIKEHVGRGSPSLPLSNGGPPFKNGHKNVKTNGYMLSSDSKGSVATASFAKAPAACTTQRVITGGTSSRSRTNHASNSLPAPHGSAQSYKTARQITPENRQKGKTEVSGRSSKPS